MSNVMGTPGSPWEPIWDAHGLPSEPDQKFLLEKALNIRWDSMRPICLDVGAHVVRTYGLSHDNLHRVWVLSHAVP